PTEEGALLSLLRSIARGDASVLAAIAASPDLARQALTGGATRDDATSFYLAEIEHYIYSGDTALHVAVAGYRVDLVPVLLAHGAIVGARNRRGDRSLRCRCGLGRPRGG